MAVLLFIHLGAITASSQVTMTKTTVVKAIDTGSVHLSQSVKPFNEEYKSAHHAIIISKSATDSVNLENNKNVNTLSEQKSAIPYNPSVKPAEKKIIILQTPANKEEVQMIYLSGTPVRIE